jgi:hypothetical protein
MTRISFMQKEEYEMEIEAASGRSVAEIVAGLNAGNYEIGNGKATIMDAMTKEIVAYVDSIEATAAGGERTQFVDTSSCPGTG